MPERRLWNPGLQAESWRVDRADRRALEAVVEMLCSDPAQTLPCTKSERQEAVSSRWVQQVPGEEQTYTIFLF